MIGNMLLEPAATHNQTLPNITFSSLLGLQDHWCFWSFGPDPYQSLPSAHARPLVCLVLWSGPLPMLTNLYHGSDLGVIRPCETFTSLRLRHENITHSGLDYVLCGVIMTYMMWQ